VALAPNLELELTANYSHRIIDFRDTRRWSYDWFGPNFLARRGLRARFREDRGSTLYRVDTDGTVTQILDNPSGTDVQYIGRL
jgi:hypothetical protein